MNHQIETSYIDMLNTLKDKIKSAQIRASLAVNETLIKLYWDIGNTILLRQHERGWGAKVIEKLSKDLKKSFPDMKGFSVRNLKYMRSFAEKYPSQQIVQQVAAQIPWGHNFTLLDKISNTKQRDWYIQKTIENGWSRQGEKCQALMYEKVPKLSLKRL